MFSEDVDAFVILEVPIDFEYVRMGDEVECVDFIEDVKVLALVVIADSHNSLLVDDFQRVLPCFNILSKCHCISLLYTHEFHITKFPKSIDRFFCHYIL